MDTTKPKRARFHRPSIFFVIGFTSILDLSGTKTYEAFRKVLPQSKKASAPLADAANHVDSLFNPSRRS
jgi:hypothetical protein